MRWTKMAAPLFLCYLCLAGTASEAAPPPQGKTVFNAYFNGGFNDTAWQRTTRDKVAKNWMPVSPPAAGKRTVVIAIITRDGTATTTTSMASGSDGWDKAAVEAVKKSLPFAALPRSWTPATLEVHFHFEFSAG